MRYLQFIGINQLKRLDSNIIKRNLNYHYFFDKMKNKKTFLKILLMMVLVIMQLILIAKYPDKKFFNNSLALSCIRSNLK